MNDSNRPCHFPARVTELWQLERNAGRQATHEDLRRGEIIEALGTEHVMFEAADPPVFEWCIKNYGSDVNLFVDPSQIVQRSSVCARASGERREV